jgi:peptidoglycan/LPS O-acetylase OafA/YrhL
LSFKPLVFVGTFSYSVYLIHAPLLQMVWQYVLWPVHLSPVAIFAALMGPGAIAILAASYAFFRVCEEPFMRQAPAKGSDRVTGVSTQAESFTASPLRDRPGP